MNQNSALSLVCLAMAALFAGCGGPNVEPRPQAAQFSAETSENFGDYELHFNAVRTDQLTPEVASNYGIQRSTNRVLLNVAMLHREADTPSPVPVEALVTVNAYNLNGQLKNVDIRRITEDAAVYYVGEVSITGNEILVFEITATPEGGTEAFTVKFQREFFAG